MNLVEYFQNLIASGTTGAYLSLAVWGVALSSVLLGLLLGLMRGFKRTVVRTIFIALSAVISYFISTGVSDFAYKRTQGKTLLDIIDAILNKIGSFFPGVDALLNDSLRALIGSFDAELAEYIVSIGTALVIAPLAFIAIFYTMKSLTYFAYRLLCSILGFSKRRINWISRSTGALIGAVAGAAVAVMILIPVAGFAGVAEDVKPTVTENTSNTATAEKNADFYTANVDDLINNPLLKTIDSKGGAIFDKLTRMTVDGKKAGSATVEIKTVASIYCEAIELRGFEWKTPSAEHKQALDRILEIVDEDPYAASLVASIMRGIYTAIDRDAYVLIDEEPLASLVDSIFSVFSDSNEENVAEDLHTVLNVYFILGDYEVLTSFDNGDALRDKMIVKNEDNKTVIDAIVDELYLNPRTAHIVGDLTEISINVMAKEILSEDMADVYEDIKVGVSDILALNSSDYETHDEYVEAVSDSLDATLKEHNIEIADDTLSNMSNYIADNYSDVTEISDEDINRAILAYYSAYANALESRPAE